MQIRSLKTKDEKFKEWINDPSVFMESSSSAHPIDKDEPDIEKSLAECIERLKNEQKESIILFYYHNRCYNEIALTMGLNEKKVKSHLQNAKRNLKLCLEEKNAGQE
jgi:RNA polymerase sigma-70 factor (ECF subfamily)